ncbi:MAG: TIGR03088 family PEP-CTERM/XrtA system glycosyltransferase [Gammaproteobacteria bacterium]|nr:TIGR03088 family PEP-CTERM/XrtA system glycosyltransferase [Gammaproteobacteria bacterium]MDH3412105.1 TIGR03088 family PEP-CTERM/XrtA system glycosyltransferase [Gammaproteobacteria bacterium]
MAHVIYRLGVGGLENGLVNLINRIPAERFRHAIVSLTDYSEFRQRIRRSDIPVFTLNKPPGNSLLTHFKLWRLLKQLRPDIVHTRNLAALEGALPAALAGVPIRVHGEHGHNIGDLDGSNRKYQWERRALKPFVHQYIALSKDLERYLHEKIHVPAARVVQLYNGVDTELFHPARGGREPLPCAGFAGPGHFILGTVGRMEAVKDPVTLARAFVRLLHLVPDGARRLRLVMVGDGSLKEQVLTVLEEAKAAGLAWLAGERDDVPRIMRGLDLFVLPSISEGISNTVLEAMASGLSMVATRVGGNPELIEAGVTGTLVPRDDPESMARAMRAYVESAELCRRHGSEARRTVERRFGMDTMVHAYMAVYDQLLATKTRRNRS